MNSESIPLIDAHDLPRNVSAFCTTRAGGVSQVPWASLNLGMHVNDQLDHVLENRKRLGERVRALGAMTAPRWLEQEHGVVVHDLDAEKMPDTVPKADAAVTVTPGTVAAIMTADCLPIVITASRDTSPEHAIGIGAIHAGWRGLANGVIEAAQRDLKIKLGSPDNLIWKAWLGPAISPQSFEIGPEVRQALLAHSPAPQRDFLGFQASEKCVEAKPDSTRYLADLYHLARTRLLELGYASVSGGERCTVRDQAKFFSHRRDAKLHGTTGRMATCAWINV